MRQWTDRRVRASDWAIALSALLVNAGCTLLLSDSPEPGPPIDAAAAVDAMDECQRAVVYNPPLDDDVGIAGSTPDQMKFLADVMNVNQGEPSIGLFRFDITGLPKQPIARATLTLPHGPKSDFCGAGCAACDFTRSGDIALYQVRSDWDPMTVTWNHRTRAPNDIEWNEAGAEGADRGALLAEASYVAATNLSVDLDVSGLVLEGDGPPLGLSGTLGVLVVGVGPVGGENPTTMVIADQSNVCNLPDQPAATLMVEVCNDE